ncbi:MAG: rod shape-determining protein MreC [Bacteroidales bacterium]|jgi:rod shape-determining protein MreC|nr:rod shape-determining protein MreC [Bacteroidales bacterium]
MDKLFKLIQKHLITIIFIVIEIFCLYFLFSKNVHKEAAFFNISRLISGKVSEIRDNFYNLINLQQNNNKLAAENAKLKTIVEKYRQNYIPPINDDEIIYISGRIISIEYFTKTDNHLITDKGSLDNVVEDMGVIGKDGVVGIISAVNKNSAKILPIINPSFNLSVQTRNNNYYGTLTWNSKDYKKAQVSDIPSYVEINVGDTIVTSILSQSFPENIPVGKISKIEKNNSANFHIITIDLFTDYNNLAYVYIIKKNKNNE